MNTNPVALTYKMNFFTFKKNLNGISQEESLMEVKNANSINWIAGHIIVSRNNLFKEVGLNEIIEIDFQNIYDRGTKLSDKKKAIELEDIVKLFEQLQEIILKEIQELNDPEKIEKFAFYSFHESYHIGQLGIIRKLIGKPGAI